MTWSMLWNNTNVSILTKFYINKEALWLLVSQVLRSSNHRLAHSVPRLLLASSSGICVSAMDVLPFCLSLIKWNSEMSPVWFIHYCSCLILRPCPHPQLDAGRIAWSVVSTLLREAPSVVPRECISASKDKQVSAISEFDIWVHQPPMG